MLQDGELCVVAAIESIWKTQQHMDQLEQTSTLDLPSVRHILSTMQHSAGESAYQGADITRLEEAKQYVVAHKDDFVRKIYCTHEEALSTSKPSGAK